MKTLWQFFVICFFSISSYVFGGELLYRDADRTLKSGCTIKPAIKMIWGNINLLR